MFVLSSPPSTVFTHVIHDIYSLFRLLTADKQTFPNIDVIGWYGTGSFLSEVDMLIHRKISEINAASVFLLLNMSSQQQSSATELPIRLFESGTILWHTHTIQCLNSKP